MKRLTFEVTLLSDIVLHADSATEGQKKTLDYIPGSAFLGVLAKKYDSFEDPYAVFHGNGVFFGDAHLLVDGKRTLKTPLSWYFAKGKKMEGAPWVHHGLNSDIYKSLIGQNIQLRQARHGWLAPAAENTVMSAHALTNYAIKSAYDHERRTSREGQMYGFRSLAAGTKWGFYVDVAGDIDTEAIISGLTGKKRIGKSRSAQYGSVEIRRVETTPGDWNSATLFRGKYLILYAESRLVFLDDFGQPALQPAARHFNLSDEWEWVPSLSQLRHQIYAPYNFKNRRFLADRVCFEKGSVFVFKGRNNASFDPAALRDGVGEYKNEGFGRVICNPDFLMCDDAARCLWQVGNNVSQNIDMTGVLASHVSDALIQSWVEQRLKEAELESAIYSKAAFFVKNNFSLFRGTSPSQWGQIRSIATQCRDYNGLEVSLFKDVTATSEDGVTRSHDRANAGFLNHGKEEKVWRKGREALRQELRRQYEDEGDSYVLEYLLALAGQMQKRVQKENK